MYGVEIVGTNSLGSTTIAEILFVDPVEEIIGGEYRRTLKEELLGQARHENHIMVSPHHVQPEYAIFCRFPDELLEELYLSVIGSDQPGFCQ